MARTLGFMFLIEKPFLLIKRGIAVLLNNNGNLIFSGKRSACCSCGNSSLIQGMDGSLREKASGINK